jgi:hypothetical protein
MENGMEICDINEKKITSSHINFHATSRKRKRCPTRYQYQTMLVLMKKGKNENNDLQNHTQKTIDSSTRTLQTIEGELGFSGQEGRPLLLH